MRMRSGEVSGYELVSLVSEFLLSERDHRSVLPDVFEMLLKNLGGDTILLYGLVQDRGNSSLRLDFAESLKGLTASQYILPMGAGLSGLIAETGQPFHVASLDAEMVEHEIAPIALGKTCYGYPLRTRDHLHSVLIFLFSRDDKILGMRPLLDAIASLLASYMGSVQLRRELFRTRKKFSLLNNYKKLFSGTLDLRPVLSVFMNITASALSAEVGIFVLFKDGTNQTDLEINWGISLQDLSKMEDAQGRNLLSIVLASREIVHIAKYDGGGSGAGKIDSLMAGSLFVQSRPAGILLFANKSLAADGTGRSYFNEEDAELFEVMRDQVANSVENYTLYRKIIEIKNFNENVLESIQSGVVSIDLSGDILTMNRRAEELCGNPLEYPGKHISEMFPVPIFSRESLSTMTLSRNYPIKTTEMEYAAKDGVRILGVLFSPLQDEHDKPIGVVVTIDDMTERRMLERRMARTEQLAALGELSAGLAHELRNPLTALKGFAQLLPRRLSDPAFLEKFSQVIANEITRLNDLVERLLVFARPGIGEFQSVSIRKVIDDTMLLLRYQFDKAGVNPEIDDGEMMIPVRCNPARLTQVFLNILINSLQAMPEGGTIRILIREDTAILPPGRRIKVARLEFHDTGSGIAGEDLHRIFNPFYTTKETGTGLGLAISFRIVEEHGGVIEVDSKEGRGTMIRVLLPMAELEKT